MKKRFILILLISLLAGLAQAEPAVVSFDTNTLTQIYNGAPCPVTVTTTPAGLTLDIRYEDATNAPVESGYYEVIASVIEPGWSGSATNYLAIDRAPQTILFALPETAVATSTLPLSATSTSGEEPLFGVISGPGYTLNNTLYFTNQGECAVAACVYGDENWRDACTTLTVQVSLAKATISLENLTQPYNGGPIEADAVIAPNYLPVKITYNGSLEPPVNVGSYAVTARVEQTQWNGVSTGTLTITKGEQILLFLSPGICSLTETSELIAITSTELTPTFSIIEGPVNLHETNGQHFATYSSTGRVTLVAAQPGTDNWLPATPFTNTFFVYENPVTIDVADNLTTYDGLPHAARLVIPDGSGLTSNDIAVTYSGSSIPPTDAGTYNLLVLITNPPATHGGFIGYFVILKADDDILNFDPPTTRVATQQLTFTATTRSGRPCSYSAYSDQVAHIENNTNLLFDAAGDVLVYAYVDEDSNWHEADSFAWLTATKAQTPVTLSNLLQPYDGTPRMVTGQADVPSVQISYNGTAQPPTAPGRYPVIGTLSNPIYEGSATNTLIVINQPEITITHQNDSISLSWFAESDLHYTLQQATPDFTTWTDVPPITNIAGQNQLITTNIPIVNNAANLRVIAK